MVYWNFDIVEFDICGAGCGTVGGFDGGDFHAFAFWDEDDGEAFFCAAGCYEVWLWLVRRTIRMDLEWDVQSANMPFVIHFFVPLMM